MIWFLCFSSINCFCLALFLGTISLLFNLIFSPVFKINDSYLFRNCINKVAFSISAELGAEACIDKYSLNTLDKNKHKFSA